MQAFIPKNGVNGKMNETFFALVLLLLVRRTNQIKHSCNKTKRT